MFPAFKKNAKNNNKPFKMKDFWANEKVSYEQANECPIVTKNVMGHTSTCKGSNRTQIAKCEMCKK